MNPKQKLLPRIAALRRDLGSMLFHFTRALPEAKRHPLVVNYSAHGVLRKILGESRLQGSSKAIKGGHRCVCFTEAPITEMVSIFNLATISETDEPKVRYEPYGIAVTKEWLFAQGGRPVIYQTSAEYDELPESLQWRHVSYDPAAGVDFTWEREWRIRTDALALEPEHTLVIVPSASEAFQMTYEFASLEADYDRDGTPESAFHSPSWLAVSLDFFGMKKEA